MLVTGSDSRPRIVHELEVEQFTFEKRGQLDAFLHQFDEVVFEQEAVHEWVLVLDDVVDDAVDGFDLVVFKSDIDGSRNPHFWLVS